MFEEYDDPNDAPIDWRPHIDRAFAQARTIRRRRLIARSATGVIACLAMLAGAMAWRWDRAIDRIETVPLDTVTTATAFDRPLNLLVVGWDQRTPAPDIPVELTNTRRADAIYVIRLTPGDVPQVLPISRDLAIDTPAGPRRLSGLGDASTPTEGLNIVANAVETLGLPVDHAIGVDLIGFESMVQRLAEPRVRVEADPSVQVVTDSHTGLVLDRARNDFACQPWNAKKLMSFIRSRRLAINGSDERSSGSPDRVARDVGVGELLIKMFAAVDSPLTIDQLLQVGAEHVERDPQLTAERMWQLWQGIDRTDPIVHSMDLSDWTGPQSAALHRIAETPANTQMWKLMGAAAGPTSTMQLSAPEDKRPTMGDSTLGATIRLELCE